MKAITRRKFLDYSGRVLVVIGAVGIFGPILAYFFPARLEEMPAEPVNAGSLAELPVGESKTIRFGRYPALILNTPDGLRAYSAVCTHFACVVKWDAALGQIVCPCHEGYFAAQDGSVLAGPPPSPLDLLAVEVIDGDIYVGGAL